MKQLRYIAETAIMRGMGKLTQGEIYEFSDAVALSLVGDPRFEEVQVGESVTSNAMTITLPTIEIRNSEEFDAIRE